MASDQTALLVMDVQAGIVDDFEHSGLLDRIAEAISAARDNGILVIYAVVGFRAGHPEIHPDNRIFGRLRGSEAMVGASRDSIAAGVAPQPGEAVVLKKRISAFAGSDLDVLLRAGQIRDLVLTGISTSGVVLSTLRAAADLDYGMTVLADCVADRDEEVQRVLLEKVFPRQAEVIAARDWIASLGG